MNAERLREAAKVLRERAAAATAGPWYSDPTLYNVVFSGRGSGDDVAVSEDFDKRADAEYIATMHPGVGIGMAKLLDERAESWRLDVDYDTDALALADLILGGES
ncbi:hypothetical protein [Luteipulveratus mongoliensis]|uniref:Uncharacterized protein n=1 Tax=Luteipulveratus mongoliensis TaxID=571913 RepID=A0A0K1JGF0_9MICO|nr:hypothetical protein [Luteipulveratus mongoliensis]AKU15779.1 hypothetical protein VV02_07790 [Luteipulveratus mongoliensis]